MPPDGNFDGVRILIVEDNPVNLDLVMQLLEDDYELLTAEDGQSGIDIALAERPDLILLDLSLPKKSGWEVCEELKPT
ncbi:MAG TPA: response regulator, partial [Phycisphaerales bacterium]|nr:response regulator [Phycisphaerales bacterium]